ncbi:MAG: hypothetical protein ABL914_00445 [Novosphingobium sp.]|uniref:hypothetical protein n=1 Tax=Novosphingobium sp. TaxID=1874826 RepID=UPI0032BBA8F4
MNRFMIAALGAALASLAPAAALAQVSPIELKGDVKVDTVVVENGKETHVLVEPKLVVPGDDLVFSTSYRNNGATPVKDFVVTNPLPTAVMLAPEGADKLVVSVDGGKTFGALSALSVAGTEGKARPAVAADVTHIRWILPVLAPGSTGKLTYHAIVR